VIKDTFQPFQQALLGARGIDRISNKTKIAGGIIATG